MNKKIIKIFITHATIYFINTTSFRLSNNKIISSACFLSEKYPLSKIIKLIIQ
jgi:hypothetical protein